MWGQGQANDLGMSFNIFEKINNHWENESFNSISFENLSFIVIREKMIRLLSSQSPQSPSGDLETVQTDTDIATQPDKH